MKLFDDCEAQNESTDPIENSCLKISLKNKVEERHVNPFVHHFKVLDWTR
jgi:hypothetical protein